MLELARLAAAMQELKDVREVFDLLIVRGRPGRFGTPVRYGGIGIMGRGERSVLSLNVRVSQHAHEFLVG